MGYNTHPHPPTNTHQMSLTFCLKRAHPTSVVMLSPPPSGWLLNHPLSAAAQQAMEQTRFAKERSSKHSSAPLKPRLRRTVSVMSALLLRPLAAAAAEALLVLLAGGVRGEERGGGLAGRPLSTSSVWGCGEVG